MTNKPAKTILEQITLLKTRGMIFRDEQIASKFLSNVSYYRLKGYWWDMQTDFANHLFAPDTYFEDVVARYSFDRDLRIILFDAIEYIEVALRTKMIYHLSLRYSSLWYLESNLFDNSMAHTSFLEELKREFERSKEPFITDQRERYPDNDADSWKILEVVSLGTLSKLYKNLHHQLPEKKIIANQLGFNFSRELSSALESISFVRNIIAHHSRLWSRHMVKTPREQLDNPLGAWLSIRLTQAQVTKPFLVITSMVYLCNTISPTHQIKSKLLDLFANNPTVPIYKLGFLNNWQMQPIWQ